MIKVIFFFIFIFIGCENIRSPSSVDPSVDPSGERLSCESQFDNFETCFKKQMEIYNLPCESGFIKGESIVEQVKGHCEKGFKKTCPQWDLVPIFLKDNLDRAVATACSKKIKV